jgi:RsiW-degrading membrane proteinase PrsW (M82 family)
MLHQMTTFFNSAFYFSGTNWKLILIAAALGILFGIIWLALYQPPMSKKPWLWGLLFASAIITWTATAFVQIPLQNWAWQGLSHFWSNSILTQWALLDNVLLLLISALVQEGAKFIPVLFCWWRSKKSFTPQFGLVLGAVSGAGFGMFEAIWVHNQILASGWTWSLIRTEGFAALFGFEERLFGIGFQIAASALAGYGLAKHKGWQYFIIVVLLHTLANYYAVLAETNRLSPAEGLIWVIAFGVLASAVTIWLRWCEPKTIPISDSAVINNGPTPQTPVN